MAEVGSIQKQGTEARHGGASRARNDHTEPRAERPTRRTSGMVARRRKTAPKLGSGTFAVEPEGRLVVEADPGALAVMAELSADERRVLQVLAIAMVPIEQQRLHKIGGRLQPPLTRQAINAAVDSLHGRSLVSRELPGLFCDPFWRDLAAQQALDDGLARPIATVIQREVRRRDAAYDYEPELMLRDVRIAWLLGDSDEASRVAEMAGRWSYHDPIDPTLACLQWDGIRPVALPPIDWLDREAQGDWVEGTFQIAVLNWQVPANLRAAALALTPRTDPAAERLTSLLNLDGLLSGQTELVGESRDGARLDAARAVRDLIGGGDVVLASKAFDRARRRFRSELQDRGVELPGVLGLLHGLALVGADRLPDLERLCRRTLRWERWEHSGVAEGLEALWELARPPKPQRSVAQEEPWLDGWDAGAADSWPGEDEPTDSEDEPTDRGDEPRHGPAGQRRLAAMRARLRRQSLPHRFALGPVGWELWAQLLASYWQQGPCKHDHCVAAAARLTEAAKQSGWYWLAGQCRHLGAALQGQDEPPPSMPPGLQVLSLSRYRPAWERALEELSRVSAAATKGKARAVEGEGPAERLTWRVSLHGPHLAMRGYLQKRGRRSWTKGRAVSLSRLRDGIEEPWCTDADRAVLRHLVMEPLYYCPRLQLDERAAVGLIGHPLVFWVDQPDQQVELRRGQARLRAVTRDGQLVLGLEPRVGGKDMIVEREGPDRLVVYEGSKELGQIAELLGRDGLTVPTEGLSQAREVLSQVATAVPVHSDIDVGSHLEHMEPDVRLYVQLAREGEGLRLGLRMHPFGPDGPDFIVGSGSESIIAEVGGRKMQTSRSLAAEEQAVADLVQRCPALAGWHDRTGPFVTRGLEDSLAVLAELSELAQADQVVALWADGQPAARFAGLVDGRALHVTVQSADNWLALRGDVVIDDTKVARFRDLLDQDRRAGRFVQLDDGAFLELSAELRRELDTLAAFAADKQPRSQQVRFHPAAALALADEEGLAGSLAAAPSTNRRLASVREVLATTPAVPQTFTGELRPYQQTGFVWLARLARLGLGACLADDMGLGKTIQVLALLLDRSAAGPALVVAPTSVCGNWTVEARRFAPTLRFIDFGAADRAAATAALGPRDVLLTSYALLAREAERLAAVAFEVVVLDEAQAIKNPQSQRARAAFELQAVSRVVATGTPIENRLGELYSIFRFLNPGLLGSIRSFNETFASPIERRQDGRALARLRRRTAPFILRRLKSEVLDELPERTEITLRVEAPANEAALYEAIRQRAVDRLDRQRKRLDDRRLDPRHRFAILAELTRLRRACCHPSLVELADEAGSDDGDFQDAQDRKEAPGEERASAKRGGKRGKQRGGKPADQRGGKPADQRGGKPTDQRGGKPTDQCDGKPKDRRGAKLSGAKLSGAKLSGAKLSGAKLSGAKLSGAKLSGAKLDALDELVDELIAAGHRALVFSQFVDVLTLIRQRFDARDLPYQTLDGSTPRAQRNRRVEAFQAGEGDVFLISTKAGGFGINLTGADFVIHVDPWWNPAVEDQASDRAHRIGQTRPVTIYRLVMAGTIEETILDLHHRKRQLASALLADTDAPPSLDVGELLELLRH